MHYELLKSKINELVNMGGYKINHGWWISLSETRKLIIIGAGNFGREILSWIEDINTNEYKIYGFIDDGGHEAQKELLQFGIKTPVVGTIKDYTPCDDEVFICSISNPKYKLDICLRFQRMGANFINIVHPTAIIGKRSKLGVGIIACPYVVISNDSSIGDFVIVNIFSSIGHDTIVETGCTLSAHCDVTGYAHLMKGVMMGSHASVLPEVRVGEFAIIGAGSVAIREVPPNKTVFGVPAKNIN